MSGVYHLALYDATGMRRWSAEVHNVMTTVGYDLLLDVGLSASGYVATCYLGIIGAVTAAPALGNTMESHAGWTEGTFIGARVVPTWNAGNNASKVTQTVSFTFTGSGTVKGVFLVLSAPGGSNNASATVGDTNGVLFSAGALAQGDIGPVAANDRLDITYTAGLSA